MIVKRKKYILFSWIIIAFFLTESMTTLAANISDNISCKLIDIVEPMWDNTTSVEVNISFDGSKAICGALVIGKASTTKITGNVVLSKRNNNGTYTSIKTWNSLETTDNILIFDNSYYVSKGYTYRLTITATVYQNGIGETVVGYYEAEA